MAKLVRELLIPVFNKLKVNRLQEMAGIASELVNTAFVVVVVAVAVAFAIAFGIGGKEFAARSLKKLEGKNEEKPEQK